MSTQRLRHALSFSDRMYRLLLAGYPAAFRQRYGVEMAQVFRDCCRAAYRANGPLGLTLLWFPTLWDWALTAARERVSESLSRSNSMSDTTALDRQLGDVVWLMSASLRSGYSVLQTFETLAQESPEPTAGVFRAVVEEVKQGRSLVEILTDLQERIPSEPLRAVIGVMLKQRETGGNLAFMLEPMSASIREKMGSDAALYPALRKMAAHVGAALPEHVTKSD